MQRLLDKPKRCGVVFGFRMRGDALFRVEQKEKKQFARSSKRSEPPSKMRLGMKFTGDKRRTLFSGPRSCKTLFYGVFSAWVRWHKDNPGPKSKFDWRGRRVVFARALSSETLYHQVADPHQLGNLGLVEVLDWGRGAC